MKSGNTVFESWDQVPQIAKKQIAFLFCVRKLNDLRRSNKQNKFFIWTLFVIAMGNLAILLYVRLFLTGYSFGALIFVGLPALLVAILFAGHQYLRSVNRRNSEMINYINWRAQTLEGYYKIIESFQESKKNDTLVSLATNLDIFLAEVSEEEKEVYLQKMEEEYNK